MKEKFNTFMENKFLPIMNKIATNRYLNCIKDGFLVATPFIIVGSFALLIFNLPFSDPNNFMYFKPYEDFAKAFSADYIQIFNVSMGILSIFVAFGIGYSLAGYYQFDQLTNGFLALYAFLLLSAKSLAVTVTSAASALLYVSENTNVTVLDARYMDAKGLFVAIIAAILSVEISRFLITKKITIKLPDSVPPAIAKSFEILIPVAVISLIFQSANVIIQKTMNIMTPELIMSILQPILSKSDSLIYLILVIFFVHILWFCGIHGSSIANVVLQPIAFTNIALNQAALAAGESIPTVFAGDFMSNYVYIGGSGATLGLCIAMIMSKNAHLKSMGKLSIIPGIFNINEPIIFGTPIVMNPIFLIPFVLTPIVNVIISYLFLQFNLVSRIVALVPWTTPSFLGAFISTNLNFVAPLLIIGLIVLDYFIYKPFLTIYEKEMENN
ncbi:PTS sugar transporter subunit IIC [Brachyspira pilosicoli]|uniref:PTS sugar transporter subunit IIC n=1 Tax=Brachyspira pilosicoli TaxID=52584 RepID=UPI003004B14C